MSATTKITGIIPTYNEEINIEAAIDSLSFVDELIIIDSYSTDKTVALANAKGVRLVQREFDDFSSQKNYAINLAKHSWIFILDADERIPSLLKKEIQTELTKTDTSAAYWIKRSNIFMNKRIKYSGWQHDKVIRLFKKETSKYDGKLAHEEIKTEGEVGFLENKLEHYTYKDFNEFVRKNTFYAQLQAKDLAKKGKKATLFHFIAKPSFRFFKHYVLQKGFLDGIEGFFIAIFYAYTTFIRYVHLWLLNRNLN